MTCVPFFDMSATYSDIGRDLEDAALRVLRSNNYIGGVEVEKFESAFAQYVEAEYCVTVSNGLSALHLALLATGVGPGDEVIVPSNTFIATWLAVSHCGATPIPVEPDPETYTITATAVVGKLNSRTKAIIPVHLYGQSVDLDPILELARTKNLIVIEDAAQAQGGEYKGKKIGGHSDVVAWSFYPGKNLGALGDAGGVTTNNKVLAEKVTLLRNYGSKKRYYHDVIGYNSRMDPLQAALLMVKLKSLEQWNFQRAEIAKYYSENISNVLCSVPLTPDWSTPVWHQYVVRSPYRDELQSWLKENGIETLIHYPLPPHKQPAYSELKDISLPVSEGLSREILSIPIFPQLSKKQMEAVVFTINRFKVDN